MSEAVRVALAIQNLGNALSFLKKAEIHGIFDEEDEIFLRDCEREIERIVDKWMKKGKVNE